jgi:DNA modification methylase
MIVDFPEPDEHLEAKEDDYQEPDNLVVDVFKGDLITFHCEDGRTHRLLCGDSTSSDDVERLMDGKKADMVFTDPPYKIQTEGGFKGNIGESLKKQCKDIEFISEFEPSEFLNILPIVFNSKKINAYVFCNKDLLPDYLNWAIGANYSFNVLIWKKPSAVPIGGSHYPDIEYLLLFRKSAIWNGGLVGVNYSRCLEFNRETGLHPTMKPVELLGNELKISSNINSIVVDFFGGSGSTMVASEQLKRICYMMELTEKYCQTTINRIIKLDETIKVKINGKDYN